MDKLVKLNCIVCGNEYEGVEPPTCCSGRDCGCMGQPIEPTVCSKDCWDEFINRPKQRVVYQCLFIDVNSK